MSSIEAWLIIILVLGVIASNIAVLKYSAKFKMPQFGKPEDKPSGKKNSDKPSDSLEDETATENKTTNLQAQTTEADSQETNNTPPAEHTDNEQSKKSHLL